jgi:hypothetical protein
VDEKAQMRNICLGLKTYVPDKTHDIDGTGLAKVLNISVKAVRGQTRPGPALEKASVYLTACRHLEEKGMRRQEIRALMSDPSRALAEAVLRGQIS